MRFFFNIVEGSVEIADPEGSDLPSQDAAQAEARAIAVELAQEFPGRFKNNSVVEALTETGNRIFAVRIPAEANAF